MYGNNNTKAGMGEMDVHYGKVLELYMKWHGIP